MHKHSLPSPLATLLAALPAGSVVSLDEAAIFPPFGGAGFGGYPLPEPAPELCTGPQRTRAALAQLAEWARDGAQAAAERAGGYDSLDATQGAAVQLLDLMDLIEVGTKAARTMRELEAFL